MTARGWRGAAVATAAIVVGTALVELILGRPPICTCGRVLLWTGEASGPANSQMLTDWYSLSHLVHGLLFYAASRWLMARRSVGARLATATAIEAVWELVENSPAVIDRYRAATIALGYSGDSVLNSVADILCMVAGFLLASRLPVRASIALGVAAELAALAAIRDNLTLNVLMLVHPIETVRTWQAA